jgi:hypothetical protein
LAEADPFSRRTRERSEAPPRHNQPGNEPQPENNFPSLRPPGQDPDNPLRIQFLTTDAIFCAKKHRVPPQPAVDGAVSLKVRDEDKNSAPHVVAVAAQALEVGVLRVNWVPVATSADPQLSPAGKINAVGHVISSLWEAFIEVLMTKEIVWFELALGSESDSVSDRELT